MTFSGLFQPYLFCHAVFSVQLKKIFLHSKLKGFFGAFLLLPALVEQTLVIRCNNNGCSELSDQSLHIIT